MRPLVPTGDGYLIIQNLQSFVVILVVWFRSVGNEVRNLNAFVLFRS